MQHAPKAVWSIPYISVVSFFPSLKDDFIAYRSFKVFWRPHCIFKIHQLWQSSFSRVYSNCCCSCSFKSEIIQIGQSSQKMYSNNLLSFQESTTILNTYTKKVRKLTVYTSYILEKIKESQHLIYSQTSKEASVPIKLKKKYWTVSILRKLPLKKISQISKIWPVRAE